MKTTWSIIKYNFFLYRIYYILFTIIAGFYIAVIVNTNGGINEEQTPYEAAILINKVIFIIYWTVSFFDYIFLTNRIFYRNVKNNKQQLMLFSKITKRKLFLANLAFLLLYSFSRMLIFFAVVSISYAFKPDFYLGNVLWLLFNITINSIFIAMFFLLICLLTFNIFDKQFLIMSILGGLFLYFLVILNNIVFVGGNLTNIKNSIIFAYLPLFGLTSPVWIETGAWQQYLNLPISVIGVLGLSFINIRLNQKVEY